MKRKCKHCEYFKHYWGEQDPEGECYLQPPTVVSNGSDRPRVMGSDYCSKWEPKWEDNSAIWAAWKIFLTAWKLATANPWGDDETE